MAADIDVRKLTNFEVATDNSAVRLVVEDIRGQTIGIVLRIETVTALLMTLPKMASTVLERANGDPRTRITYPVTEFRIETTPEEHRILSMGTPDGFMISFSLTATLSDKLEAELRNVSDSKKHWPPLW